MGETNPEGAVVENGVRYRYEAVAGLVRRNLGDGLELMIERVENRSLFDRSINRLYQYQVYLSKKLKL